MTSAENGSSIQIEGLTVRYGKATALADVSFRVPEGSVCALLGRNGAGKSSLVRCLLGQQKPQRGAVRLFGADVWREREELMQRVGVVHEESDIPPEMSALQVTNFCSRIYRKWRTDQVLERLDRFGVPHTRPVGQLSKGQKRQVALALALASEPDLLVLDDPTLGLDVVARKALFEELVGELADRRLTVFMTTHDLAGMESIADRVVILKSNSVALDEDVESLKWRFRRLRYTRSEGSDARQLPELQALAAVGSRPWGTGVEAVVSNFDDVSFSRFRSDEAVRDVEVTSMSLEEIFVAIAGDLGPRA